MGRSEDRIDPGSAATVAEVWRQVSAETDLPDNLLMAVNQTYVGPEHPVCEGDEVAFFPPVTGG